MDGGSGEGDRGRLRRLRWRLRGAWLWPMFALATLVDAMLLHWLPLAGDGTGWVAGFLLGGCVNIIAVAAFGALGGWWLRRRRRDLPKVVADDYVGTGLLVAVAATFFALGLVHRPQILDRRVDFTAQSAAVRRYVASQAPPEFRARVNLADSIQIDDELYRTCVPGDDPRRWLCLLVDTTGHPATPRRDTSAESNASFNAPGGFR
ncbi:MAG: hypothetical protein H0U79_05370 [Solirubrobacterales bacterium]|nr:hypothetical protein [Solirubrobacterales bacterium]